MEGTVPVDALYFEYKGTAQKGGASAAAALGKTMIQHENQGEAPSSIYCILIFCIRKAYSLLFPSKAVSCKPAEQCTTPDHVIADKDGKLTAQVFTLKNELTVSSWAGVNGPIKHKSFNYILFRLGFKNNSLRAGPGGNL